MIIKNKKYLWFFVLFLLLAFIKTQLKADIQRNFTVGVYKNHPMITCTKTGEIKGIYADILDYVSANENWKLNYNCANWQSLLDMLEKGEIDILPVIAYSVEREKKYEFSNETVFSNWGEVVTHKDFDIDNLFELENKKIAVLKEDIYYTGPRGIKNLVKKLGINCDFIEVKTNEAILKLVSDKIAEAGVISRVYYLSHKSIQNTSLKKTHVVFNPTDLRFAFTKKAEHNKYLISTIDKHMQKLKTDENSIYYKSIDRHIGISSSSEDVYLPVQNNEIIILIITIVLIIFISILFPQIKQIPNWQAIIIAIMLFFLASVLSVLEGFFLRRLINIAEHICYTISSIALFIWCYKFFTKEKIA